MMLMAFGFNFSLPSPNGPYTEKHTLATREEVHWQHILKDQARREAGKSARKDPKTRPGAAQELDDDLYRGP